MQTNKVYHELYSLRISTYEVKEDGKKEMVRTTKLPHHATMDKAFPNMSEFAYMFDIVEYAYHVKYAVVLMLEMRCRSLLSVDNEYGTAFKVSKRTVKFVVPQDVRVTNAICNIIRSGDVVLAEIDDAYAFDKDTHTLENFAFSDVYIEQLENIVKGKAVDVYRIHNDAPRTAEGRFTGCLSEQLTN